MCEDAEEQVRKKPKHDAAHRFDSIVIVAGRKGEGVTKPQLNVCVQSLWRCKPSNHHHH